MATGNADDYIALQGVMTTYAAAVDERDRERYAACFATDVEVIGFGDTHIRGIDNWLDYVWAALERYSATQHLLGPILATLEGDTARTRSDVQAMHILADSGARFTLWATYVTDMRREGDTWRIARHELVVHASETV